MTPALKPYASVMPSGVPWLGDIPKHWPLIRIKALLAERSEKGHQDRPLLAATQTKGVVRKESYENRTVLALKDLHLLKLVEEGDFVISLRSFQGGIEYARDSGIISPAYTVLYPKDSRHHSFLALLFKSRPFVDALVLSVTGIREGQNIDYGRLARSALPLPPPREQTAIARFLDHMDRRIQKYIRAKEKLIALLDEYKQALIHQAVTGQIDVRTGEPYEEYKESGVEWIGMAPKHWGVAPLKRVLTNLVDCEHKTAPRVDTSNYYVIRTSAVRNGSLNWDGAYCTDSNSFDAWTRRCVPRYGDVIFTREAPAGEACLVPRGRQVCLGQRTVLLRTDDERYVPSFLVHMIYQGPPRFRIELASQGTTVGHFNVDEIGSMPVLLPPIEEQKRIVATLALTTSLLGKASSQTQREVHLFNEFRARLIADVVTGKLDVRDAAAALPDVDPSESEATATAA